MSQTWFWQAPVSICVQMCCDFAVLPYSTLSLASSTSLCSPPYHRTSANPHFQYAARAKNLTYTDHCRRSSEAHVANMCWKKAIREMGFRYEHRHIGPICLISFEAGHPWRFHVHENHQPGDFVCHQKLEHAARYVHSHPAKWAYDEEKKSIVFASNQSVLYTFLQ